jgi:hypothetical protein
VRELDTCENQRLEHEMAEGYLATREERRELNHHWQIVDGEDWPPDDHTE